MKAINRTISTGDLIELGDLRYSELRKHGSGYRLRAVSEGETKEYVVLQTDFDGDLDDVTETSKILGVADGRGMQSSNLVFALPSDEF